MTPRLRTAAIGARNDRAGSGAARRVRTGKDRCSKTCWSPAFEAGPPENHGLFRTYVEEDPNPRSQQLGHPAWLEWWEAWFAPSEILNGEQTVDEAMGKRVEQSNLILEQSAEAYQELKDYIAGLGF